MKLEKVRGKLKQFVSDMRDVLAVGATLMAVLAAAGLGWKPFKFRDLAPATLEASIVLVVCIGVLLCWALYLRGKLSDTELKRRRQLELNGIVMSIGELISSIDDARYVVNSEVLSRRSKERMRNAVSNYNAAVEKAKSDDAETASIIRHHLQLSRTLARDYHFPSSDEALAYALSTICRAAAELAGRHDDTFNEELYYNRRTVERGGDPFSEWEEWH